MIEIKVLPLEHYDRELPLPFYATHGAAGADIRASLPNGDTMVIAAGKREMVPTGLIFEIPEGYEVQVRPRSGLSLKTDLLVVNSPGTIDCDYRGEVKILLGNFGNSDVVINHGERLAQLVIAPVIQGSFVIADAVSDTHRGSGGFGSTGVS